MSTATLTETHTMFSADEALATRQRAVLIIVLVTYLMILLDTSIVITGLPDIRKDFGFTPSGLSWVQNAYTLFFGSLLLVGARAGDLFGRKRVFMTGVIIFTLSSLVIGVANSGLMMVIARAVQGIGAAILAPATMALLTIHFAEGEPRTKALSAYAATAGVGASLGLVLGGFFAGAISWRVGFLINVPVGMALWMAGRSLLVETARTGGKLDIVSALLSTLGIGGVVYAIVSSANGWLNPEVIAPGLVGLGLIAEFLRRQLSMTTPLLPLTLFSSSTRTAAYIARGLFIGSMVGLFFYSTQLMQEVLGMTPFQAGLGFLPMTVTTFIASLLVPYGTRRIGNGGVLLVALAFASVGLFWLGWQSQAGSYFVNVGIPMLLIGLGNGSALGPLTIAGVKGVAKGDAGAASGMVNTAHQIGGTLGLALLVAIAAKVSDTLPGHITSGYFAAATFQLVAFIITAATLTRSRAS